jgi:GxxExxY protein
LALVTVVSDSVNWLMVQTPPASIQTRKRESRKPRKEKAMGHQFEALSGKIIEAALHVHKALGPGFLEGIYHNTLCVALRHRGILCDREREICIFFEGEEVGLHRLDLMVESQIVVELKAVEALEKIHFAQVKSYLKATGLRVGLLLNFNAPTLVIKRIVL